MSVENLLYFAELVKSGKKTKESFFEDFDNKEITYFARSRERLEA